MARDAESGFDMEEYERELDEMVAKVLPDDHEISQRVAERE